MVYRETLKDLLSGIRSATSRADLHLNSKSDGKESKASNLALGKQIELLEFQPAAEFVKYLEDSIVKLKSKHATYTKLLQETKDREERRRKRITKLRELKQEENLNETRKFELGGYPVLLDPTPEYELKLIEHILFCLQDNLSAFERTRELVPLALSGEISKVCIVLSNNVPVGCMVYSEQIGK
jgi:hypothetical protein